MRKVFFTLGLIALILTSCGGGNGTLSLSSYNEKAISIFNAASEKMHTEREVIFEHKLSKEENAKLLEGMNTSLDEAIAKTNELKYPEDAKTFHESIINLYKFQKETIMPLLTKTQEFEPESEEWYAVWRQFDKETEKVDGMLNDMGKLQEELAKKANATLK